MTGSRSSRRAATDHDRGAAAVMIVVLTPVFLALAGLVLDGGRAIAARQRAADLAEQAARAGANALNISSLRATGADTISPSAAHTAACSYVATVEPGDGCAVTLTPTSVTVTVTTRTPTVLLGLMGVNTFTTSGHATARAVTGITTQDGHS